MYLTGHHPIFFNKDINWIIKFWYKYRNNNFLILYCEGEGVFCFYELKYIHVSLMLPKIKAAEHDFASKNIDSIFIYTLCKIGKAFYARFTVFDCLCNRYVSVHISSSSWFNNKPYSDKEKMNKSPCVAFLSRCVFLTCVLPSCWLPCEWTSGHSCLRSFMASVC